MSDATPAPTTLIIGDGPGGLSAALFLAKKGHTAIVFGQDQTPMHDAMLYNYLGIDEITGSAFQEKARAQVQRLGATLRSEAVTKLEKTDAGFTAVTEAGEPVNGKYVIIAVGPKVDPALIAGVGLKLNDRKLIDADRDGRTATQNVYAIGWSTRPNKIQAVISAGDGAAAAIDILSKESGKNFHDFDVVEK